MFVLCSHFVLCPSTAPCAHRRCRAYHCVDFLVGVSAFSRKSFMTLAGIAPRIFPYGVLSVSQRLQNSVPRSGFRPHFSFSPPAVHIKTRHRPALTSSGWCMNSSCASVSAAVTAPSSFTKSVTHGAIVTARAMNITRSTQVSRCIIPLFLAFSFLFSCSFFFASFLLLSSFSLSISFSLLF